MRAPAPAFRPQRAGEWARPKRRQAALETAPAMPRIMHFRDLDVTVYKGETNMNTLDSMLQRNKDFAAQQSAGGALMPSLPRALPNAKAVIIGCADMRVDPRWDFGRAGIRG